MFLPHYALLTVSLARVDCHALPCIALWGYADALFDSLEKQQCLVISHSSGFDPDRSDRAPGKAFRYRLIAEFTGEAGALGIDREQNAFLPFRLSLGFAEKTHTHGALSGVQQQAPQIGKHRNYPICRGRVLNRQVAQWFRARSLRRSRLAELRPAQGEPKLVPADRAACRHQ